MPFDSKPIQDFLGSGIIFPIEINAQGKTPVYTGLPLIIASIKTIFAYQIGTKFFEGEFGARLEELLEEPNDEVLGNLLTTFIQSAIYQFEKRVVVLDTEVVEVDDKTVSVQIIIQLVNTQITDSFIWPFYRNLSY